jgi:peroxiredoxin
MDVVEHQQHAAETEWLEAWLTGPARTRLEELPAQIGDPAPNLILPDTEGRQRWLSDFWRERPALVLFLRQFGCSCLAGRWEKLRDEVGAFEEAGAQVVAVCQAEPERAAAVARRRGYPFPLLCDPIRRSYETYGLPEGTPAQILHDFAWKPDDRATGEKMVTSRRGSERALVDSPWQLPGEFVIGSSGKLVLTHRYQYCEDFPPKTVILGAIQAARGTP